MFYSIKILLHNTMGTFTVTRISGNQVSAFFWVAGGHFCEKMCDCAVCKEKMIQCLGFALRYFSKGKIWIGECIWPNLRKWAIWVPLTILFVSRLEIFLIHILIVLLQMQIFFYNPDDFDSFQTAISENRIIGAMAIFFQVS